MHDQSHAPPVRRIGQRPGRQYDRRFAGIGPVAEIADGFIARATHQDRVGARQEGIEAEVFGRVLRGQPVVHPAVRAGDLAVQQGG